MFHGIRSEEDRTFFDAALQRFVKMFPRVFAADNVILFNRTLGYEPRQRAANAFAERRQHPILELPTGQGLLIKRAHGP
jgi:hypothetical protein